MSRTKQIARKPTPRRSAEQVFRDAAEAGADAVARWLCKNDVDKDLGNLYEFTTPLHVAIRCGAADVARQLLAAGANVHARERKHRGGGAARRHLGRRQQRPGGGLQPPCDGTTTLLQVVETKPIDYDLLQRFLDAGVDLHAGGVSIHGTRKVYGDSPAMVAAYDADARALDLLLAAGAKTSFYCYHLKREATLADAMLRFFEDTFERKAEGLRVLVRYGMRATDPMRDVTVAIAADDPDLLRQLLDLPATPGSATEWLHAACVQRGDRGGRKCMQALVQRGALLPWSVLPDASVLSDELRAALRRWRTAYLWRRAHMATRVRWVLTRWHEDCCAARYNLTKDDMEEEVADFNAAVAAVLAPQA